MGTLRALKLETLPRLLSEDDDSDDSESMLDERERPLRSDVLRLGPVGCVRALRATLRTPKSPQLSSADRLRGRALNWLRLDDSSSSSSRSAALFTFEPMLRRNDEKFGVLGSVNLAGPSSLLDTGVLLRGPRSSLAIRSLKGSSASALLLNSLPRERAVSLGDCGTVRLLVESAAMLALLAPLSPLRRASPSLRRFLRFSTASSASRILTSSVFTTVDLRERIEERNLGDFGTVSLLADPDWAEFVIKASGKDPAHQ